MEKSYIKPWEKTFEIRKAYIDKNPQGEPDFRACYGVFYKNTDNRPNTRYYSCRIDAMRGAAQIYNRVEKLLLGLK